MNKNLYIILLFLTGLALLGACNTKKNTATNRRLHAFTARYNTYFNGKTSFDEALASLQDGYKENYTEQILMFPVSSLPKDKNDIGGPFDRAIEKGNKAIKQHSIQQKPPRKPGWRNDPKQAAWQAKNEYNPFLKHCWLLIGQGQFYNADFLQASATFSYITRHYADDKEMVTEARIWQARCYSEINWLHESGSVLDNIKENGFPQANQKQFDRVYADYLIKSNQLDKAPPYLEKAIKSEKNKRQRTRMRYLLGQIYAETGQNEAAYQTFKKVVSANPPYELEFAARIRQTEVFPGGRYQDVLKMLNRMAKSEKNKDYLDQVYYAIGNIYMERQDTAKAIENYSLGIEKSTQNGLDKAICQIRLGDIYYTQKDYIKAQPCFSGAMAGIYKEYKDYDRISHLSSVLDELVVHVEAIHLQDSLQELSKLPEEELLALIDKKIEEVKKKEEEEAAELEKQRYLAEQESMGSSPRLQERRMGDEPSIFMPGSSGGGGFYFYNEQTVAQGKTQFQTKWGKRTLEDNWRLRKKPSGIIQASDESGLVDDQFAMAFDEEGNPIETTDSLQLQMDSLASDPKSREYYLQQIPFSEEDKEASNLIIADGLFNSGMIYKDKLVNKSLAVEAFEELERRFPENEYRLDYYFQSFLMGLQHHDNTLRDKYKQKLASTFPESDYAIAASDPNYEYNVRMMDVVQDSLYENTYNSYLANNITEVRQNYKKFSDTYPLSKLMPKFMFIDALTYVQEGDADGFKTALDSLVKRFPREDVSELANEMLKGLLRGRTLVKGSFGTMKWNIRFGMDEDGMLLASDTALKFVDEPNTPHQMVLIYETGNIDRNQLLYTIAAYNFAKFDVKTFDLQMEDMGTLSLFIISGFNSLDEVLDYTQMIFESDGYGNAIAKAVSFFPFSERNFGILMRGKTLEEYISFFAEHYADKAPALIQRWKISIEDDEKIAEAEDAAVEKAADIGGDSQSDDTVTTPNKEANEVIEEKEDQQEEALVEEKDAVETDKETTETEKETTPEKIVEEEPAIEEDTEETKEIEESDRENDARLKDSSLITDEELIPDDTTQVESQKTVKPKEITLEDLLERSKQRELEEEERKAEEERLKKEQRKEAEDAKKQKEKEREQLRKQKEKEAKERLKQKEKERKEKERQNRLRQKEKEAQRKATQKEKEQQRKAALKEKDAQRREALKNKTTKKAE